MGAFGEKFRKQREKRAFSLDDVANVTKIGSRMLKAIEEERFEQLPGGVFNKGFIRTYAKHLGLNDNDAITEYLEILQRRQAQAEGIAVAADLPATKNNSTRKISKTVHAPIRPPKSAKVPTPPQDEDDELPNLQLPRAEHVRPRRVIPGGGSRAISWTAPALVLLLVVAGFYWWSRHSRSARAAAGDSHPSLQVTQPAEASEPQIPPSTPSTSPSPSAQQPPSLDSKSEPLAQASSPPVSNSSAEKDNEKESDNDVTKRTLKSSAVAQPESRPALTLTIRAVENSWVSVTADGQHVTQETLIAPAHTSVRANREIVVKAGNSAAVSFLFNGKEFPPQGSEGEVKTFVFDASGMSPAPTAQAPESAH